MTKKPYFQWINIARGIGMFLVVCGHAISDSFTGDKGADLSFDVIYSFHMPLFFFISGFCAYKVIDIHAGNEKFHYIKERFFRLMVPYFVVAIIYVPLDVVFASFTSIQHSNNQLLLNLLRGVNPNYQMWTLYTLFGVACFVCIANRLSKKELLLLALVACILNNVLECPIEIIGYIASHLLYFVVGICTRDVLMLHEAKLQTLFSSGKMLLVAVLVFTIANYLRSVQNVNPFGIDLLKLITAASGIISVLVISVWLSSAESGFKHQIRNLFSVLGVYGMDIYIMGNLCQVFSRVLFLGKLGIPSIVSCMISIFFGIVFPLLASKWIVRRSKILKRLILGIA